MNYLWAFMILSGVIFSAFHGTIPAVTGAVLDSAKEAVTLCITMTGVMSFWMGLMRIAERGGVIAGLSRKLKPVLRFLFPLKKDMEIGRCEIKGGLVCYHGHGIVINAEKIGKNLSIWQGVTIGKNINSEQLPIIGDNVKIGAGAVVMKDVPSDSVVIGNPCVIKKR